MPRVPFMGLHEKFCTHILRCFVSFYQAQPCYRRSAVSKPIARAHSSVRTPLRFCICINLTIPDTETFTPPPPYPPGGGEYARGYANVRTAFHFKWYRKASRLNSDFLSSPLKFQGFLDDAETDLILRRFRSSTLRTFLSHEYRYPRTDDAAHEAQGDGIFHSVLWEATSDIKLTIA